MPLRSLFLFCRVHKGVRNAWSAAHGGFPKGVNLTVGERRRKKLSAGKGGAGPGTGPAP